MYYRFRTAIVLALLTGCAAQPTASPDLRDYKSIEIAANDATRRTAGQGIFDPGASTFNVTLADSPVPQRLLVQVEDCRNSPDPQCQRAFFLGGDLDALGARIRCYVQIRNDVNIGYAGQALQGLCTDRMQRTYTVTISR